MERRHQIRLLLAISVVLIGGAVWFGGRAQRSASDEGIGAVRTAQDMLTARLDIETGLRGFLLTGREGFLQPYVNGIADYRLAARRMRSSANLGAEGERLLADSERVTRNWLADARRAIVMRRDGDPVSLRWLRESKQGMDRFRAFNAELVALAEQRRRDLQDRGTRVLLLIIVGLVLLAAMVGYFLIERPATRRKKERSEQAEFVETLQFATDEREAQALLCKQLERSLAGSSSVVFTRNNSENRLEAVTELQPSSPLVGRIETAVPSDCLAVRRGRPLERRENEERLLACELCGALGANSLCLPSLVGGEVIGSVLVSRDSKPLTKVERRGFESTVTASAPVLANLRNLAIAETRAVTDSLTGLANARAAAQDLNRIVAFAGRSEMPLVAILLDLDHFKRINDNFGHQVGDQVLAALGDVLRGGIRASDFVARYGGEEFLILLQDTDVASGVEMAEKLREAVRQMHVPDLTTRVTASFGVASIPAHANDGDSLVRAADRALYAAKKAGRDQVCTAGDPAPESEAPSSEGHDGMVLGQG